MCKHIQHNFPNLNGKDYIQHNWLCLALFFLKALLLKNWTSGVVLVVVVRLLQGL